MLTKIVIVLSLVINSVFLWGSVEKLAVFSKTSFQIYSFGFLWPSLVWSLFFIISLLYLIYLQKLGSKNLIQTKHLLFGIVILLAPHIIGYILGMYYTMQTINIINSYR